jgi:hypothetical protein
MAGLTEEYLDMLSYPGWSHAAIKDIYSRHKIPTGMPLEQAVQHIQQRAMMTQALGVDGGTPSAWANPEERAAAREEYARQGKTPTEVQKRWDESIYLMDPRTYQHMQRYGRDLDMLGAVNQYITEGGDRAEAKVRPQSAKPADPTGIGDWKDIVTGYEAGAAGLQREDASTFWDRSKGNPLYRESVGQANYQQFGGAGQGVANAISNPDLPLGNYMTFSETLPNHLRMQGSGETDTASESWQRAQAARLAGNRYRFGTPGMILDIPSGQTNQEIGKRIEELQKEISAAAIPMADERWQRTTGWTPPGAASDALDFFISWADPTAVIPVARGAGALTTAARAAAKGAKIAGRGWIAPAVRKALSPAVSDLRFDAGLEQAIGHPLVGITGGPPGRTDSQYWLGGGKPGEDFAYKTDEQVADAKRSGQQLYERLKDDDGVSRADTDAYNRLVESGALPRTDSDLHPRPQWRMHSANKQ